jgi:DNA polymerase bacteriophage-type
MTVTRGLYIDIKTRSVCDHRKADPRAYAENWSTDIWVAGYAIGQGEVKLWHPDDPVPEDLTQAISSGLPIISYDAPLVRALFVNIMGPRHGWPIPPLTQWICMAAMAATMDLPTGLDDAAKVMGIAERKDNEARSLIRRMTRPRSRTPQLCAICGKMTCDHHKMFKTSLAWCDDHEDRARLDAYCVQDVRIARALFPLLRPLSQSAREAWLRDQITYERDKGFDWSPSEPIASSVGGRPARPRAPQRKQPRR